MSFDPTFVGTVLTTLALLALLPIPGRALARRRERRASTLREIHRVRYFAPQYVTFEGPSRAGLRVRSGAWTLPGALVALMVFWILAVVAQLPEAFAALSPDSIGGGIKSLAKQAQGDWLAIGLGWFYLGWGLSLLRRWGRDAEVSVERDGRLIVRRRGLIGGSEDVFEAGDYADLYLERGTGLLHLLLVHPLDRTTVCLLEDHDRDLDDVIETARAMRRVTRTEQELAS